jgi:hypothetical protein
MQPAMFLSRFLLVVAFTCLIQLVNAQTATPATPEPEKKTHWYENIAIRGYAQFRYNRLLETNDQLKCEQCDRSWGDNGGFFIRRMRVILYGQIFKKVYFYIQPDFASSASTNGLHFAQLRDAYVDIGFDNDNEFRLRVGQSKVPYGFEILQSSQNRLPLDRSDALNSGLSNERDLGAFFYWAPKEKRALFSSLVRDGYKGSGDYGIFAFGAYNGQTANRPELNDELHLVTRLTYPFEWKGQIFEPGIQAYTGNFVIAPDQLSSGTKTTPDFSYTDERVAASLIMYPKPFGFQAEYNIGRGPEYNKATDSIEVQDLKGGYILLNYRLEFDKMVMFPFVRYQAYDGGKKHERDARSYDVSEFELGLEWQPNKTIELVAMYTISDRTFEDHQLEDNQQSGNLLRLQLQLNF